MTELPPPWQEVARDTGHGWVRAARILKLVGHGQEAEHGVSFWYHPSDGTLERCDEARFNSWIYLDQTRQDT